MPVKNWMQAKTEFVMVSKRSEESHLKTIWSNLECPILNVMRRRIISQSHCERAVLRQDQLLGVTRKICNLLLQAKSLIRKSRHHGRCLDPAKIMIPRKRARPGLSRLIKGTFRMNLKFLTRPIRWPIVWKPQKERPNSNQGL